MTSTFEPDLRDVRLKQHARI